MIALLNKKAPGHEGARRAVMRGRAFLVAGVLVVFALSIVSLLVGVSEFSLWDVLTGQADSDGVATLVESRLPRTLAIVLAGAAMAMTGLVMQLLVRNKFVEPSTVGVTDSAALGLLLVTILFPGWPIMAKMGIAAIFALGGAFLFVTILNRIPLREVIVVPLVGIMLAGVISSVSTFIAYERDLLATLSGWTTGSFATVIKGRYELIWLVALGMVIAWVAANAFTVAGLGEAFTTNLGMNYRRIMALGMSVVALVSAIVIVVVGALPFLGLVVPNIVSLLMGDYLRRSLPWVAIVGAGLVLICDLLARTIIAPAEIPIGTVMGVVGGFIFLMLLLRKGRRG